MSVQDDIARIKLQEQRLRFASFDEAAAWKLGSAMRDTALARNLPFVIDIRTGIRPLFYAALPGSTAENADWVRRKVNTVLRFHKSSYRVGREYELRGLDWGTARGIDPLDFAPAGGGFPVHLIGTGVVGAVTVSGVPQRDDHNFVVEMLSAYLGVPHGEVALEPETSE